MHIWLQASARTVAGLHAGDESARDGGDPDQQGEATHTQVHGGERRGGGGGARLQYPQAVIGRGRRGVSVDKKERVPSCVSVTGRSPATGLPPGSGGCYGPGGRRRAWLYALAMAMRVATALALATRLAIRLAIAMAMAVAHPVCTSPVKSAKAHVRWAARRYGDTRGTPPSISATSFVSSPDLTIHQPTSPWSGLGSGFGLNG